MRAHRRTWIVFPVLAVTLAAGCSKSERSPARRSPQPSAPATDAPTVSLELPRSAADEQPALVVAIAADGRLFFGSSVITNDELPARIAAAVKQNPDLRIVVHADRSVPHGTVIAVMRVAKDAGVRKLAIATAAP